METTNFTASVQYDDWKGSVAADNADLTDFHRYLENSGQLTQDEMLHAIEFYSGIHCVLIHAYVGSNIENLKKIDIEMSRDEFFSTFKRFKITLSQHGEFEGKDISFERVRS
ncbi:hypothetical protein U1K26_002424 [Salmonella enterica]|uniref:hypothetical protein n=1 Tax=Salmonella enterica TaxID=28901 RepID=UPI0014016C01|nr:hypothetical protein [Salmonella enterica]EDP9630870.1 hypothetical protein [Salmonella enterica subsp. enterica]EIB9753858.1 hypothetical protein [Salmonella enterica subsp. enterica serovar Kintambo]HBJ6901989.1 hypothetical protein [Salmonella enterica subsp. enterica serovar Wyldegreen]HCM2696542.1 hypothetical protein [Salmonella enterica subsp. enterica serovar Yaba]EBU4214289.1 hypothetical protein [Salmonella enterica]